MDISVEKKEIQLAIVNPFPYPSAVHRYSSDISDAFTNSIFVTLGFPNSNIIKTPKEMLFLPTHFLKNNLCRAIPNYGYGGAINFIKKMNKNNKKNIIHYSAPMKQFKIKNDVFKVVTFHDSPHSLLSDNLFGDHKKTFAMKFFQKYYLYSFKNFENILADTESTKHELIRYDNFDENKITVINPAISSNFFQIKENEHSNFRMSNLRDELNLPKDKILILSVSTMLPRKNLGIINEVMNNLGNGYKLVRVGKSLSEKDITFSFVTNETLNKIYNACDVLLFPSFYEGFGYPMVEAFACGLPVVASDIPVFKEISKGSALLVNPIDPYNIAESIRLAVKRKKHFSSLGIKRSRDFSMDTFKIRLENFYKNITM